MKLIGLSCHWLFAPFRLMNSTVINSHSIHIFHFLSILSLISRHELGSWFNLRKFDCGCVCVLFENNHFVSVFHLNLICVWFVIVRRCCVCDLLSVVKDKWCESKISHLRTLEPICRWRLLRHRHTFTNCEYLVENL